MQKIRIKNAAAIAITDKKGCIVECNRALQEMLGYSSEAISGMHWSQFVYDEDVPSTRLLRHALLKGERKDINRQIRYKRKNGEIFWVKYFGFCMTAVIPEDKHIIDMSMSLEEEEFRESRYRSIFEMTNIGMSLVDMNGKTLESNRSIHKMLGYSHKDLENKSWMEVTHPDDREQEKKIVKGFRAGTLENCIIEKRFICKNGKILWGKVAGALLRDPVGDPQYIISTLVDITKRKMAEKELLVYQEQIRSLASELTFAEEQERRHIAMYLHNRLAQNLSFCKMKLDMISESLNALGVDENLDNVIQLIEDGIQDIRSVIIELSPPVLYELGLEKALDWLADKMLDRYQLNVKVNIDNHPKPVNDELRGILFRAVNELLINVVKHAHTDSAKLLVRRVDQTISITIIDKGVGFNPSKIKYVKRTTGGFGLFNIKERMNYLGGKCVIESSPQQGTTITLAGPLSK